MKKKIMDYEIVNHGPDHSDYFQGCGTYGTPFDEVSTGIGTNAKEAYQDALEGLYQLDLDRDSLDKLLPVNPRNIRKKDKIPKNAEDGCWWYVSVRVKTR